MLHQNTECIQQLAYPRKQNQANSSKKNFLMATNFFGGK